MVCAEVGGTKECIVCKCIWKLVASRHALVLAASMGGPSGSMTQERIWIIDSSVFSGKLACDGMSLALGYFELGCRSLFKPRFSTGNSWRFGSVSAAIAGDNHCDCWSTFFPVYLEMPANPRGSAFFLLEGLCLLAGALTT